jgi:hypothetical protein
VGALIGSTGSEKLSEQPLTSGIGRDGISIPNTRYYRYYRYQVLKKSIDCFSYSLLLLWLFEL